MRKRLAWTLGIIVTAVVAALVWTHRMGEPEDFADPRWQFKYGSIGTDHPMSRAPIPYWIWKVLPEMFPPASVIQPGYGPTNDKKGYAAFGLITEAPPSAPYEKEKAQPRGFVEGLSVFERPIGLSKRTVLGLDFVGVNCSFCHITALRKQPGDAHADVVLGGTGNTIDIEKYFLFLFGAFGDPRFTGAEVMKAIAKHNPQMGFVERLAYRFVLVPYMGYAVKGLKAQFDFIDPEKKKPEYQFGPGRLDTWAAYKRSFVHPPIPDKAFGVADFPAIWNQRARLGMRLHWDGNTHVLEERNIISALALIGPNLGYMDVGRLKRITDFTLDLLPPQYDDSVPYTVPQGTPEGREKRRQMADKGRGIFDSECAACHAAGGLRVGRVEPLAGLGTERHRMEAFSNALADALNQLQTDTWKLREFSPQGGYANGLLDGIWLRAPYLHNGSVPTLRDLLEVPKKRPAQFCRGSDVYDWDKAGFASAVGTDKAGAPSCGALIGASSMPRLRALSTAARSPSTSVATMRTAGAGWPAIAASK